MDNTEYKVRFDFFNLPNKLLPSNCGAYILTHTSSNQIYIGSSGDLMKRMRNHRQLFLRGTHHNKRLQVAYNSDHRFTVVFIMTPDREAAYGKEQELIDLYVSTGAKITNVSMDARLPGLGCTVSPEHREKLSKLRTGKALTEATKEKLRVKAIVRLADPEYRLSRRRMNLGRKRTEEEERNWLASNKHRFRPVMIKGILYDSCPAAGEVLNVPLTTIRNRCKSPNVAYADWYYIKPPIDEETHGPEEA